MKIASVFATTVIAVGLSMSGAAIQSAYAADAAATTCADFLAMSPADQQTGFDSMQAGTGQAAMTAGASTKEKGKSADATPTAAPTVGAAVSACQADPTATVSDAMMRAMGGNVTTSAATPKK